MDIKTQVEIAENAFIWCINEFGSPIKSVPKLIVKTDKRVRKKYGHYINKEITIYLSTCNTKTKIVKTIIHEYAHFLQMPKAKDIKVYYKLLDTFEYDKHPFELQAQMYERMYYRKCITDLNLVLPLNRRLN
jgi:hypothetical protein